MNSVGVRPNLRLSEVSMPQDPPDPWWEKYIGTLLLTVMALCWAGVFGIVYIIVLLVMA